MNDYQQYPYGQMVPQPPQPGRPGSLIAAFVIGLIDASLNILVGILIITGNTLLFSTFGLHSFIEGVLNIFSIPYLIIGGTMLVLWIFTFNGRNWARIFLVVIFVLDLIVNLFSLNLILLILNIIMLILISNRSVVNYCLWRSGGYRNYYQPGYYNPYGEPPQQFQPYPQNQNFYGNPYAMQNGAVNIPSSHQDYITETDQVDDRTIPVRLRGKPFGVLIAEQGPLKGQTFKLSTGRTYVIGRAGDIKLPADDLTASREHARIRDENGKFVIYDMGSTNRVYVNGEKTTRKVLINGDKIKLGKTVFRFQWMRGR